MKSLDKLRDGYFNEHFPDDDDGYWEAGKYLADEIQAEIDLYYLPRPLFEDGKPVQVGDTIKLNGDIITVKGLEIWLTCEAGKVRSGGDIYERAPELDTQEKINDEKYMLPSDYVRKHYRGQDLDYEILDPDEERRLMIDNLLLRQRKVCEGRS